MSWGPEAQESVFNCYQEGLPERQIVGVLQKEWAADDKTVRRCLTGLDLIDQKTESADWNKDRFERLAGTEHYLVNLRRAYAAYKRRKLGEKSGGNTDDHKKTLISPLTDLQGIGPLDVHDLDLATFYSRPAEPSWPIAKARVWRELNGGLSVRLDAENNLVWTYLRQHLVDDRVWPALEDWKIDIATDFLARMASDPTNGLYVHTAVGGTGQSGRQPVLCLPIVGPGIIPSSGTESWGLPETRFHASW